MLLQLENRLGKVEYIIDGEPTSGFEGSASPAMIFYYSYIEQIHRGCPGMQDCPSAALCAADEGGLPPNAAGR